MDYTKEITRRAKELKMYVKIDDYCKNGAIDLKESSEKCYARIKTRFLNYFSKNKSQVSSYEMILPELEGILEYRDDPEIRKLIDEIKNMI